MSGYTQLSNGMWMAADGTGPYVRTSASTYEKAAYQGDRKSVV